MNHKILRMCIWLAVAVFVDPFATASNAPVVSGSYEVEQSKAVGSQTQIKVRIHLMNHGSNDFSIQRMTLWGFSHSDKGGTRVCALALHAHATAETTQEFTIRRPEYESWRRGLHPRLVLEMMAPSRTKSTAVVRLDRISSQEAK
jgi:hypothetical protein